LLEIVFHSPIFIAKKTGKIIVYQLHAGLVEATAIEKEQKILNPLII